MRTFLLVAALVAVAAAHITLMKPMATDREQITGIFAQTLNHTNPESTTFNQRYWIRPPVNPSREGPLMIYISGEAEAHGVPSDPSTTTYPDTLNAWVATIECRYFGKSNPFDDTTVANLAHLTTANILGDLNKFTAFMQKHMTTETGFPNRQVISYGGSFSGALSAFFKTAYPNTVDVSIASSGVVEPIVDFYMYDNKIARDAKQFNKRGNESCYDDLLKITQITESMLVSGEATNKQIKALYGAPADILDRDFRYFTADTQAAPFQYGFPHDVCGAALGDSSTSDTEKIVQYTNWVTSWYAKQFGTAAGYVTAVNAAPVLSDSRSWVWLTCTEYGFFQTSAIEQGVMGLRSPNLTVSDYYDICDDWFAPGLHLGLAAGADKIRATYGGAKGYETSYDDIIFFNGSEDPWAQASVKPNEAAPSGSINPSRVVSCPNCSHCADLRPCPGGCLVPSNRPEEIKFRDEAVAEILSKRK